MSLSKKAHSALGQPLQFDSLVALIIDQLTSADQAEISGLVRFIAEVFEDDQTTPTSKLLAFELLDRCTVVPACLSAVSDGILRDLYVLACNEFSLGKSDRSFFESPSISRRFSRALSRQFVFRFLCSLKAWADVEGMRLESRFYRYLQRATRKGMISDLNSSQVDRGLCTVLTAELKHWQLIVQQCSQAVTSADFAEANRLLVEVQGYRRHINRDVDLDVLDCVSLHGCYLARVDLACATDSLETFIAKARGSGENRELSSRQQFDAVVGRKLLEVPIDFALLKPIVRSPKLPEGKATPSPAPEAKASPSASPPSPQTKRKLTVLNSPQFTAALHEKIRVQVRSR
jgi:hypothetical protein